MSDSAKGSIVYSWTEKEETVEDLVGQAVKVTLQYKLSHILKSVSLTK